MQKKSSGRSARSGRSSSFGPRGKSFSRRPSFNREDNDSESELPIEEKPKAKAASVAKSFAEIWTKLFSSPIHLDSALSKLPTSVKSILARIVPVILLKPASLAEVLGIGVAPGEPWSLSGSKLGEWRPATLMATRIYELLVQKLPEVKALREDFPGAMIEEWESTWGTEVTDELVRVLCDEPPLALRASQKVGALAVLKGLTEGSKLPVKAELSPISPFGVRLSGYAPVLGTELYKSGSFEIQDEGSQLMALFALSPEQYGASLSRQPGEIKISKKPSKSLEISTGSSSWTVIDTCAGAGGKTLAMADALKGKGRVYAYDTSVKKLQALKRRMTHAGLNNIQPVPVEEGAEEKVTSRFEKSADIVLVDAPCSGWGVLRRNPDIKWRQNQEVLDRMPLIQKRLLDRYSTLVAPGGRLVFGVCTFRKAETLDIVAQFLETHSHFTSMQGGFLGPGPCDGFFMQAFQRKGSR